MKRKSVLVLACLALVLGIGTAAAWGSQVSLQQTHNYLLYYPTTHTTDWGYANVWYVGEARHHPEESALFGSSMSFNIPQITQGLSHLDASPQTWQKRVYTMTRVTYLTEAFMLFNFGQDVTGHGPEPASPGYIKQSVENEGGFAFQPQAAGLHLMALVGIYDLSFALEQGQGSPYPFIKLEARSWLEVELFQYDSLLNRVSLFHQEVDFFSYLQDQTAPLADFTEARTFVPFLLPIVFALADPTEPYHLELTLHGQYEGYTVPVPATALLLGSALGGVAVLGRRRRQAAKRRSQALLALSLGFLFLGAINLSAFATYHSTQITDNAYDDTWAQIDNNSYIVWSGYKGADWEIFRWDPSRLVEQLTFNTTNDVMPDINDPGQVVFVGVDSSGNPDIWRHSVGNLERMTDDPAGEYYPQLSNYSGVCWGEYHDGAYRIAFVPDPGKPKQFFGPPMAPGTEPAVSDRPIAWVAQDNLTGLQSIYVHTSPSPTWITSDPYPKGSVDISAEDNQVWDLVWDALVDGDWEIFRYHDGEITQITDNDYNDRFPRINQDGLIVWEGYDGAAKEIFLYQPGYEVPISQITNNLREDTRPRINNLGQVVYTGFDGTDWEVYLADNKENYFSWDTWGGTFRDANKIDPDGSTYDHSTLGDAYMCWAATAADALDYGGWEVPGLDNEQRILTYFRDHWSNEGGFVEDAEEWWVYGDTSSWGSADVELAGGNFWPGLDFDDYHDDPATGGNLDQLYFALTEGGASIAIAHGIIDPRHVVAAWGVRYHSEWVEEPVPNLVTVYDGLWITDNNDSAANQSGEIPMGRHLIYLPVVNVAPQGADWWDYRIAPSYYNDYEYWWFNEVDYLRFAPPTYWSYDFTFQYAGGGDSYRGKVYAEATRGYYKGQTWLAEDESGQAGQYTITASDRGDYSDLVGQVVLENYSDIESQRVYSAQIANRLFGGGNNYLGSESGYIIEPGFEEFHFGNVNGFVLEADLLQRFNFDFRYNMGAGDSYNGLVYAGQQQNYRVGIPIFVKDEHGQDGYYSLYHLEYCEDPSQLGKVEINYYYDQESGNTFAIGQNLTGGGSNFLQSEYGFIIWPGVKDYLFGNFLGTFYEADQILRYYFMHFYANGDLYQGWVYAGPDKGYEVGKEINTHTEGHGAGHYEIVGEGAMDPGGQAGQVFVEDYYDSEIGCRFTPVHFGSPVGTDYLTSEVDYIIEDGKPEYRFGGGPGATEIQEADGFYTYFTQYILSDGSTFTGGGMVGADFAIYFGAEPSGHYYWGLAGTLAREGNVVTNVYAYLLDSGDLYWGVGVNDLAAKSGFAFFWDQDNPLNLIFSSYQPGVEPYTFSYTFAAGSETFTGTGVCSLPLGGYSGALTTDPDLSFTGGFYLPGYSSAVYNLEVFYARNFWGLGYGLCLLEYDTLWSGGE